MPNLTPSGLANILAVSTGLKKLYCHDCVLIGTHGGEKAVVNHLHELSPISEESEQRLEWKTACLPSLQSVSCGWGFGHELQRAVWKASPWLVSFRSSIGASMSDRALAYLAASCCHLECLELESCPVTSKGTDPLIGVNPCT